MDISGIKAEGPCCPVSSPLQDIRIPWVPASETNVAETFKRQVALMRSPYYESAYDEVTQTDWLEIGGFK